MAHSVLKTTAVIILLTWAILISSLICNAVPDLRHCWTASRWLKLSVLATARMLIPLDSLAKSQPPLHSTPGLGRILGHGATTTRSIPTNCDPLVPADALDWQCALICTAASKRICTYDREESVPVDNNSSRRRNLPSDLGAPSLSLGEKPQCRPVF